MEQIKSDQGEIVTMYSDILKEDRKILIYTPKDSINSEKRYPVIYVLDADNHFAQMVEYSKYLSRQDVYVIPPMIVVGITNTNRVRDLTPSKSNFDYSGKPDTTLNAPYKNSGGNEFFFQFIQKELLPYVNSNYKIQPYRILAGHSFGGLTAINCLINYPDMFNAYIAVSPSFWWDQKFLLKLADKKLKAGSSLSKTLFFSDGNEGSSPESPFHKDVLKFDSLLKSRSIKGLNFEYTSYPMESHMTVPIKTYYDGLRFVYHQWALPPVSDEKINSEIIMKHYKGLSQRFGYPILPDEAYFNGLAQWLVKSPTTINNGIKILEMNTVNYPSSSRAFMSLGAAYTMKGEKQKAIALYKKASELNPTSNEIKLRLQDLQK
ncbi:alpha/beta hydrolase-fold protein [Pedobacter sp. Leaf216]|uniref:alpha/beta hydrolase-fold protein n=1 Tax=Pedobacter sp. Leaf216 TaxID=1735684 RepID=UPI00138EF109|nr:alpha/beta hydrolase-fold protein [Pedobacter sp. Leaf216]